VSPEIDRFIHLATRPLEGREQVREEAVTELMERLGHRGVPLDAIDLSEPIGRLESRPPMRPARRRGALAAAVLGLAALVLVGAAADLMDAMGFALADTLRGRQWELRRPISSAPPTVDAVEAALEKVLRPHLFRGAKDPPFRGVHGDSETARLRERFPEDLGILQEHLARRSPDAAEFMTAEERALIERLDPDNALWPLLEIRWMDRAIHYRSWRVRTKLAGSRDEQERGRQLFREAAARPFLRNHAVSVLEKQKASLPPPTGVMELLTAEALTRLVLDATTEKYQGYGGSSILLLEEVSSATSAGSERITVLFEEMRSVQELILASGSQAEMWMPFDFPRTLAALHPKRFGVETAPVPEMPRLQGVLAEDAPLTLRRYGRSLPDDLTAAEMLPLRRAEWALTHRVGAWLGCAVLLALGALVWLESVRRSRRVKGLARGLMPLLTWRDHLWIGLAGILLPWLWFLAITRLTPLGSFPAVWDDEEMLVAHMIQPAAALVFGVVAVVLVSRWRWQLRGGFLGLGGGVLAGATAAVVTALAIPAAGLLPHLGLTYQKRELYVLACACAASAGALWLLWRGILALFTGGGAALQANLTARTALLWLLAGLASLITSAGVLRAAEAWWISRDPLMHPATSHHFPHALEERALTQRSARMREWVENLEK
jgi:hypothetical protein